MVNLKSIKSIFKGIFSKSIKTIKSEGKKIIKGLIAVGFILMNPTSLPFFTYIIPDSILESIKKLSKSDDPLRYVDNIVEWFSNNVGSTIISDKIYDVIFHEKSFAEYFKSGEFQSTIKEIISEVVSKSESKEIRAIKFEIDVVFSNLNKSLNEVKEQIEDINRNISKINTNISEVSDVLRIKTKQELIKYYSNHIRFPSQEELIENDNVANLIDLIKRYNFIWMSGPPLSGKSFAAFKAFLVLKNSDKFNDELKEVHKKYPQKVYFFFEPDDFEKVTNPTDKFIEIYNKENDQTIYNIDEIKDAVVFLDAKNLSYLKLYSLWGFGKLIDFAKDGKIKLIVISREGPNEIKKNFVPFIVMFDFIDNNTKDLYSFIENQDNEFKNRLLKEYKIGSNLGLLKNPYFVSFYLNRIKRLKEVYSNEYEMTVSIIANYEIFIEKSFEILTKYLENDLLKYMLPRYPLNEQTWALELESKIMRVFPTPVDFADGYVVDSYDYPNVKNKINEHKPLFIIGESGSGKTTLALKLVFEKWLEGIPVFLYRASDIRSKFDEFMKITQILKWKYFEFVIFIDDIQLIPIEKIDDFIKNVISNKLIYSIYLLRKESLSYFEKLNNRLVNNRLDGSTYGQKKGSLDKSVLNKYELHVEQNYYDILSKILKKLKIKYKIDSKEYNLTIMSFYIHNYLRSNDPKVFDAPLCTAIQKYLEKIDPDINDKLYEYYAPIAVVSYFSQYKIPITYDFLLKQLKSKDFEIMDFEKPIENLIKYAEFSERYLNLSYKKRNSERLISISHPKIAMTYLRLIDCTEPEYFDRINDLKSLFSLEELVKIVIENYLDNDPRVSIKYIPYFNEIITKTHQYGKSVELASFTQFLCNIIANNNINDVSETIYILGKNMPNILENIMERIELNLEKVEFQSIIYILNAVVYTRNKNLLVKIYKKSKKYILNDSENMKRFLINFLSILSYIDNTLARKILQDRDIIDHIKLIINEKNGEIIGKLLSILSEIDNEFARKIIENNKSEIKSVLKSEKEAMIIGTIYFNLCYIDENLAYEIFYDEEVKNAIRIILKENSFNNIIMLLFDLSKNMKIAREIFSDEEVKNAIRKILLEKRDESSLKNKGINQILNMIRIESNNITKDIKSDEIFNVSTSDLFN